METPDCSFILSVERGKLEAQAVLLVESLRRFGGTYANCPVYAVSARPARQMSRACAAALTALGAQPITLNLVPSDESYGTVARMAACAWAEQNLGTEIIVGLDDDLFFAAEPDFNLSAADFFARPVDAKGMCTSNADDPYDGYWHQIAQLAGVSYDEIPWLETTTERIPIKASYNGGMLAVRRPLGLFTTAYEIFNLMRAQNLHPPYLTDKKNVFASTGFVGLEASRWWGSSQAAFSLAATKLKAIGSIAPSTYNIPAHLIAYAKRHGIDITLKDAVLVHYHWLLDKDYIKKAPFFDENVSLPPTIINWLKEKTPLGETDL